MGPSLSRNAGEGLSPAFSVPSPVKPFYVDRAGLFDSDRPVAGGVAARFHVVGAGPLDKGRVGEMRAAPGDIGGARGQPVTAEKTGRQIAPLQDRKSVV